MAYEAKIIADSICNGYRLTTMQLTHPRIVHAEFMTHCAFARNASSSRAIPFSKSLQKVLDDPFIPVWWGKNQKGMQAAEEITESEKEKAIQKWLYARDKAVEIASSMAATACEGLNIHKQIVNRLIEPWSWITVCVTGDWPAWSNYFALRCHKDAQPEIQKQAYMAQKAYFESTPRQLIAGQWHTPYVDDDEIPNMPVLDLGSDYRTEVLVSVGRCARTSYLTQEGKRDFQEDIRLHNDLRHRTPMHASPFEHVCQARGNNERYGKFTGWLGYRHMIPGEMVTDFKPNYQEVIK